jgi:hypothetical protein
MRGRPVAPRFGAVCGSAVSGTVTSLHGPVAILDGLVTIDLSGAKLAGDPIDPGALIFAELKAATRAGERGGRSLVARTVRILNLNQPALPTVVHGAVKRMSSVGKAPPW